MPGQLGSLSYFNGSEPKYYNNPYSSQGQGIFGNGPVRDITQSSTTQAPMVGNSSPGGHDFTSPAWAESNRASTADPQSTYLKGASDPTYTGSMPDARGTSFGPLNSPQGVQIDGTGYSMHDPSTYMAPRDFNAPPLPQGVNIDQHIASALDSYGIQYTPPPSFQQAMAAVSGTSGSGMGGNSTPWIADTHNNPSTPQPGQMQSNWTPGGQTGYGANGSWQGINSTSPSAQSAAPNPQAVAASASGGQTPMMSSSDVLANQMKGDNFNSYQGFYGTSGKMNGQGSPELANQVAGDKLNSANNFYTAPTASTANIGSAGASPSVDLGTVTGSAATSGMASGGGGAGFGDLSNGVSGDMFGGGGGGSALSSVTGMESSAGSGFFGGFGFL